MTTYYDNNREEKKADRQIVHLDTREFDLWWETQSMTTDKTLKRLFRQIALLAWQASRANLTS